MENDLDKIRKKLNGEDHPGDVWLVETIEDLCQEVEELRQRVEDAWEELAGEDI